MLSSPYEINFLCFVSCLLPMPWYNNKILDMPNVMIEKKKFLLLYFANSSSWVVLRCSDLRVKIEPNSRLKFYAKYVERKGYLSIQGHLVEVSIYTLLHGGHYLYIFAWIRIKWLPSSPNKIDWMKENSTNKQGRASYTIHLLWCKKVSMNPELCL